MKEIEERARRYAFRLLGQRPYTEKGIRDKLFHQGFGKVADKIGEKLKELQLINDDQFALSYIETRLSKKPKGRRLLTRELQKKGVNPEIIKKTLDKLLPREKELFLAKRLSEEKVKQYQSLNKTPTKQKLYFYLRGRGFGEEIIEKVIETILPRSCYELNLND